MNIMKIMLKCQISELCYKIMYFFFWFWAGMWPRDFVKFTQLAFRHQLHCPKTSADTNKPNQLYISILFSEFQLSIIEGVFFPLLHECDYLGRLIRQTLIKNFTLLPWVEEWLFLKCLIYVLFLKSVSYGCKHLWAHGILVAPEKTFVSAYPTLLPSNTPPPPLHFPVGWPVTVQMLAKATTKSLVIMWINQLLNIASPNGRVLTSPLAAVSCGILNAELFHEAYAARQTCMKFASAPRHCYEQFKFFTAAQTSMWWIRLTARKRTQGERDRNSSMSRCGIVRANKSSQTRRSAGARGSLWMTFIPKCTAPFAPAGAYVHHTPVSLNRKSLMNETWFVYSM